MAGWQCDPKAIEAELKEAGIRIIENPWRTEQSEVNCGFEGVIEFDGGYWEFKRAWYYWVAKGPGIAPEDAMELHEKFGQVIRVDGHCGCPPPSKSFATDSYHVDTQEGLNALAALIKKLAAKVSDKGFSIIEDKKKKLAEATEKAIIDQMLCYNSGKDESEDFENECQTIRETAETVTKTFKGMGWDRKIYVCDFCARNGMQDESEICQKECPARPRRVNGETL